MIKLVVVDLDGTLLLNHGKSIYDLSKESEEAIKLSKKEGIIFAIASGRALPYSYKLMQLNNIDNPKICAYNGAVMYDDGNIIETHTLSREDVLDIFNEIKKHNLEYETSFIQTIEGNRILDNPNSKYYQKYLDLIKTDNMNVKLYPCSIDEFVNKYDEQIGKYSIIAKDSESAFKIRNLMKDIFQDRFNINTSTKVYVEFSNYKADKEYFIDYLMKKYDLKEDEIAAIGDSYNDYRMLKKVKYSYVMSHSDVEFKKGFYKEVENVLEAIKDIVEVNNEE